jgi:hypothetical protein
MKKRRVEINSLALAGSKQWFRQGSGPRQVETGTSGLRVSRCNAVTCDLVAS